MLKNSSGIVCEQTVSHTPSHTYSVSFTRVTDGYFAQFSSPLCPDALVHFQMHYERGMCAFVHKKKKLKQIQRCS